MEFAIAVVVQADFKIGSLEVLRGETAWAEEIAVALGFDVCVFPPVGEVLVLPGASPCEEHFLCFIRLFWNQIFTCLSVKLSCEASSALLSFVRKWLKWNSFSSSKSCFRVYAVLFLFPSVVRELHILGGATKRTKKIAVRIFFFSRHRGSFPVVSFRWNLFTKSYGRVPFRSV